MNVDVDVRHGEGSVDPSRVEATALFALEFLDAPDAAEASVTFVDDAEMARLNGEYRGKEGPTDVLSFECDSLDDGFPSLAEGAPSGGCDAPFELGDVVIAPDVAARQAAEFGATFDGEVDMLVVHGVLHLLGYDHVEDADAAVMEPLQRDVLSALAAERRA